METCFLQVGGLHLWMREVDVFLHAEDAALGDLATLEAQIKESNALQDDIETLQPNVDNINEAGENLMRQCEAGGAFQGQLEADLAKVNNGWKETVSTAKRQNSQLAKALETSMEVTSMVKEINTFLDQLEGELVGAGAWQPVTAAPELSQRTFRLLQLREKTARKGEVLERLSLVEVDGLGAQGEDLGARISAVQERWGEVTGPVHSSYSKMREATTDYGEFKTLVAQESDWLDRLEKKLRRSSKAAADAEEISEELDDIENCLNNHPEERIARLRLLASGLGEKDILISPVQTEADKLATRWVALERQARERIRSLEECIMEAQEWECKILCVQDWLAEKDMLLTSHLEHELTVEDLADETQVRNILPLATSHKCMYTFCARFHSPQRNTLLNHFIFANNANTLSGLGQTIESPLVGIDPVQWVSMSLPHELCYLSKHRPPRKQPMCTKKRQTKNLF